MTTPQHRRLDRIEAALSPKEAVIAWMLSAQASDSFQTYISSMAPLIRITQQMEQAVRSSVPSSLKGKATAEVRRQVRLKVRDTAFFYFLIQLVNLRTAEHLREHSLYLGLVSAELSLAVELVSIEQFDLWWPQAREATTTVLVQQGSVEELARRYFAGHTPLFPRLATDVAAQVCEAEQLVDRFNSLFSPTSQRGKKPTAHVEQEESVPGPIDLSALRTAVQPAVQTEVALVVDLAKSEAFRLVGEPQQGLALLEHHLSN